MIVQKRSPRVVSANPPGKGRIFLPLVACVAATLSLGGAEKAAMNTPPMLRTYCYQCHGKAAMGGVNLEQMATQSSIGDAFRQWQKVAAVLEQKRMPPPKTPQPAEAERQQALLWVRAELHAYAKKHDGEPGNVTVRRLTSGEYGYTVRDLTGLDLDWGIDAASDSVGGEGFTNYGDVQFMQEANVERYLEAAKRVADHAVIGAGPLDFFVDPGKSGFEISAITRIRNIYAEQGFRTVSGEGGIPYGLDKYGRAFYVAWRYRHRAALGEATADIKRLAAKEGVSAQFAQHIWNLMNKPVLGYPSSEVAARWRKLPTPGSDAKASAAKARAECEAIEKYVTTWPSWLFARGDIAAGGAGDESPLVIDDASLKLASTQHFVFNSLRVGGRNRTEPVTGPTKIFLNVATVTPDPNAKPVVIWRNPTIAFRRGGGRPPATDTKKQPPTPTTGQAQAGQAVAVGAARRFPPAGPKQSLRSMLSPELVAKLNFGKSPDGTEIGPDDFAAPSSVSFELPVPDGVFAVVFEVDAQVGKDRDQVFRITFSDREDGGTRGIPTRGLLGDPQSAGYRKFKAGVLELAAVMPPNSQIEPTPADKDPAPEPLDSKFNTPEHDEFVLKVKYVRGDRFIYQHMLDEATRRQLDNAWNDLYASFDYHDNYVRVLAQHFSLDLKGKRITDLDQAALDAIPAEARKYIAPLVTEYKQVQAAQAQARRGHIDDCLRLASRAWRRPLTEKEKQSLRSFYDRAITLDNDHRKAIHALLTRILVSPSFLYRVEQVAEVAPAKPLAGTELASRLSFFLWSSIPDDELQRAAAAGELANPQQLQRQVKRMLADPRARRLSTEFFGQWLGFYHFDQYRGVDTGRFPEFTGEVKNAMYDEAVSFFEHIIRNGKPVRDILFADYTFLNTPLANHYGVKKELKAGKVELVDGANAFQRGGLLRLGALLTATSAPLRTSPVKRGDWLLRRVLGTPVPPPPADAGSIPADDKLFGGLSLREKLEQHKRNPTCANCHMRIDPLGFPLERYDSIGRVREKYADGKPVYDSGKLSDETQVEGVEGLLRYLQTQEKQVLRTLAYKLVGYALGRTVQPADELLIQRMAAAGGNATFAQLISEIVTSRQFRNHTGREEAQSPKTVAQVVQKQKR